MTKEEFTLQRLKEDAKLYTFLYPIYIAILVIFLAMCVYAFVAGKKPISLGGGLIMLSLALKTPSILALRDGHVVAAKEYEKYLADPNRDDSVLSEQTLGTLRTMVIQPSQLLQQWVSYGILSIVLIAAFIFLALVIRDEPMLLLVCSSLLVMGIPLGALAIKTYESWKIAKSFEE